MLSVKIETPANHMTEDARWDYRVTIVFKNSALATTANPDEERFIKQLGRRRGLQARGAAPFQNSAGALGSSRLQYHAGEEIDAGYAD